MIIVEAELRAALGLAPAITEQQNMHVALAMHMAHAGVKKYLRYDPEQRVATEYYPLADTFLDTDPTEFWDVNRAMTRAIMEDRGRNRKYLQLRRLPIRSVSSLYVDVAARFGTAAEDFAAQTAWVQGVDFSPEFDQDRLSLSGFLIAHQDGWPTEVGTVKVTYRAGYSPLEFQGPQTAASTDADSNVTDIGVDASPIKAATLLAGIAAYHTLTAYSVNTLGLIATGPKQSETLGSYSYSLSDAAAASAIAGMKVEIPDQSKVLCEQFVNWGVALMAA